MRIKPTAYLYFTFLLLPGFLCGLWLRFRLGVTVNPPFSIGSKSDFSFTVPSIAFIYVMLMRLPLTVFCTGYTVFAPFVGSLAVLYLGACLGSALPVLPSLPIALLLALLLTVFVCLCAQAATHRHLLRFTAPDARRLIHSAESRSYLVFFLALCTVYLGCAILLTYLLGA